MKKLFSLLFLISICWQVCAQKSAFVRVYDIGNKKIKRGHVLALTDTLLLLKVKRTDTVNLSAINIGTIKTRRSAGHNILIGSLIGMGAIAIVGAATAEPDPTVIGHYTAGEGAAAGAFVGLVSGAAIGGITTLFKNSKTFIVNGDLNKWNNFKTYILEANNRNK